MFDLFITAATALAGAMVLLWLISIWRGHVSFIDAFWGTGFIVAAGATAWLLPALGLEQTIALILLTAWGLRLSIYLLKRYLRNGEDLRYVKILGSRTGAARHLFSLWFVFGLQGVLILIIVSPVIGILAASPSSPDGWTILGASVWAIGAFFEWIGDWQLSRFKANPDNEGKVLNTGLWALTRHPNYFGDACVWWGLWLVGHDITLVFAPALMTFLLMKWSGVPLLERGLKKRRPGYADYINRTNAFFPGPPKNKA
ncbi:MAG: DUF1295 domain-containing protein [Alphaproteobacteria bacterium]|nr:DUF1295 domain-containing protein [Alphaproteobacteria bacterium]